MLVVPKQRAPGVELVLHPDFWTAVLVMCQYSWSGTLHRVIKHVDRAHFWEALFLIKPGVPRRTFLAVSFAVFSSFIFLQVSEGDFWKLLKYMQQETGEWGSFPVWGGPDVSDQKPVCIIDRVSPRPSTCRRLSPISPWVSSLHACRSSSSVGGSRPVSSVQPILQSKTPYCKTEMNVFTDILKRPWIRLLLGSVSHSIYIKPQNTTLYIDYSSLVSAPDRRNKIGVVAPPPPPLCTKVTSLLK